MHSLELTNIDKSRVYRSAMNAWSNDKQSFRPPDIRPIVPIESGRASLSQPLQRKQNDETNMKTPAMWRPFYLGIQGFTLQ